MKSGKSTVQIINELCFDKNGLLLDEFEKLFSSLFEHADIHVSIIRTIAKRRYGISRKDLIKAHKLKSVGKISSILNELMAAGFIERYIPFGKKIKDHYYRVTDEYTLFHLHWVEPFKADPRALSQAGYWQKISNTQKVAVWAGYTFEEICYKHVYQISKELGLDLIIWTVSGWQVSNVEEGAQIDLIFDRNDDVVSICEIKYSTKSFKIDRVYASRLNKKLEVFEKTTETKKSLQLIMITNNSLCENVWSQELVAASITLEDLFA